jgi:hypothetical protein
VQWALERRDAATGEQIALFQLPALVLPEVIVVSPLSP